MPAVYRFVNCFTCAFFIGGKSLVDSCRDPESTRVRTLLPFFNVTTHDG